LAEGDLFAAGDGPANRRPVQPEQRREPHAVLQDVDERRPSARARSSTTRRVQGCPSTACTISTGSFSTPTAPWARPAKERASVKEALSIARYTQKNAAGRSESRQPGQKLCFAAPGPGEKLIGVVLAPSPPSQPPVLRSHVAPASARRPTGTARTATC
jgi:hypothetical protein